MGLVTWALQERPAAFIEEEQAICSLFITKEVQQQVTDLMASFRLTDYGVNCTLEMSSLGFRHHLREWEYPWAILNGNILPGLTTLDAGGGGFSPLKYRLLSLGANVTVVDLDEVGWEKEYANNCLKKATDCITFTKADLRQLPYPDNHFERVFCVSTLEHIAEPLEIVKELWRVVKPGGRLIVTVDVTPTVRYNHTISPMEAAAILRYLNLPLPETKVQVRVRRLIVDEINPAFNEPTKVPVDVLCFYQDKV